MLSISEVASILNISEMTVRRKLKSSLIKGVKVGKMWRISAEEVERIKREGV